jgi:small GTP-binding protein
MPRLADSLSHFFGRVEILARGAEAERRAAEEALARRRPLDARDHARALLARVPSSPIGLALWAEAAEDAWLDDEVVEALRELARLAPWRADVWLRLGRAGRRVGWPEARDALERAASAPDERESARLALLDLCDEDLAAGDPTRAGRWLDRVAAPLAGVDHDVALRRAECALARGELDEARRAAASLHPDLDAAGRTAHVRAQLALADGQGALAVDHALRAFVLEAPGGAALLAALIAASRDVVEVDRVRRVVAAAGLLDVPAYAAAFAFAEGRRDDARRALAAGLAGGDRAAAAGLLRLAQETRDVAALDALAERDPSLLPPDLRSIRDAALAEADGRGADALDALDEVHEGAAAWADDLRRAVVARWTRAGAAALPLEWPDLFDELRRAAKRLDRLDLVAAVEALTVERERPLRAAVVGEFNAGKSTFLNALLGGDVAPTGVLPTTATLHWVAWAQDPFARVVVRGEQDRVVPHEGLKAALRALATEGRTVLRVLIHAPIERLKRVEILDTPGFNAPDPEHIRAARAAFDEAHVAIWLFDATSPMKESERRVLAEVQGLGVPVQILVNKSDRVAPGDLPAVLEHVRAGLAESGLASRSPPLAMSARLALRGRLGDAAALEASGWAAVEALFAEGIVDASESLRERALRRKSLAVASELASLAEQRSAEDRERVAVARERRDALLGAAARLAREAPSLARDVERALDPARRTLLRDLQPIAELGDERRRGDPGVVAYAVERASVRLGEPLAREIARAAGLGAPPPRAAAAARAVVFGAASVVDRVEQLVDRSLERVVRAAIDAFAQALVGDAEQSPPSAPHAALALRLAAVRDALDAASRAEAGPATSSPRAAAVAGS